MALFELLINTPAVGNLIREGKTHQLPHVIQTGQQVGMITFQQSYQQRVGKGVCDVAVSDTNCKYARCASLSGLQGKRNFEFALTVGWIRRLRRIQHETTSTLSEICALVNRLNIPARNSFRE